jgi:hypothetical protein
MSQSEARAWWADVEHLRETIERRRALAPEPTADPGDELAARRGAALQPVAVDAEPPAAADPRAAADSHDAGADTAADTAAAAAADAPDPAAHAADELAAHRRVRAAARRAAFDRDAARRSTSGPTPADRRAAMAALAPGAAGSGRRTVQITGRAVMPPAPRALQLPDPTARRQAPRMSSSAMTSSPDRIAMWAVVMAFLLIVVAAMSAH